MSISLSGKIDQVRSELAKLQRAVVGFSGGVDSSLILKLAHDELQNAAVGALAVSASLPQREKSEAIGLAREIGVELVTIDTGEVSDPAYAANAPNRCFHCKDHVYDALRRFACERGLNHVLDGMNAEDTLDIRPGRAAAMKHGVRSLLNEAGFSKAEVRAAAKSLGLPNWNKPQAACLSSRVAYGIEVTMTLLQRIEAAEEYLKLLGMTEVRVRHHGDVARVELAPGCCEIAWNHRSAIAHALKELGWTYVTLDLEELRHGSMNASVGKGHGNSNALEPYA